MIHADSDEWCASISILLIAYSLIALYLVLLLDFINERISVRVHTQI